MFKESDIRPEEFIKSQEEILKNDIEKILKFKNDFVSIKCPVCESDQEYEKFYKNGFRFVECKICETLYANPRPKPEHLKIFYLESENYNYWNKYIFPASEDVRRKSIFIPRIEKILNICNKLNIQRDFMLEIGAGHGTFCEEVKKTKYFKRVLAIEPNPDLAMSCTNRGVEVIQEPFECADIPEGSVNVIASFEVIEHLFSPKDFLQKCYKLISDEGLLILTCPNVKGFDISLLGAGSSSIDHEHINMFHLDSLERLLKSSGFKLVEKSTPGQLDAEIVRKMILSGKYNPAPFFKQVLIDNWDNCGNAFQKFLSENNLSSHMWIVVSK